MSSKNESLVYVARLIQQEIDKAGFGEVSQIAPSHSIIIDRFDTFVVDADIRAASESLFRDGHYARSVEEAFKCLNNFVKNRCRSAADGNGLMTLAFSVSNPILALNKLKTQSHRDEQQGYMQIFAGSMTGIRNPRAHEHRIQDDVQSTLELLCLASHLIQKAKAAKRRSKKKHT